MTSLGLQMVILPYKQGKQCIGACVLNMVMNMVIGVLKKKHDNFDMPLGY